jgi:putative NADH-flavin reductase
MRGDVLDLPSIEQVVVGQDAVLSILGVPYSRKPITVYSQGTANIIQAMKHHGLRRLVCVSSGATNPHDDPQESFIFRKIIKPIIGRTLYADMARMEALVKESDLDWTIIRAARLFDTSTVTHYQVAQAYIVPGGRKTSRTDLADFMLQQLTADEYVRDVCGDCNLCLISCSRSGRTSCAQPLAHSRNHVFGKELYLSLAIVGHWRKVEARHAQVLYHFQQFLNLTLTRFHGGSERGNSVRL